MPPRKYATAFLLRFMVLYLLLIAPWPGWRATYGCFLVGFISAVFASGTPPNIVQVRLAEPATRPQIDVEVLFGRGPADNSAGNAPAEMQAIGLDSRGVGWVPTALLLALVGATPSPRRRWFRSLALATVLVHGYLLVAVGCFLWNRSRGAAPVSFLPYAAPLGDFLEATFVEQLGPSFVIPVLLWLLVVFIVESPAAFISRTEPRWSRV
jgi:hypothetical protein